MEDYFDRVQSQLAMLTRVGAHTSRRRRIQGRAGRARAAIPVLASALVVLVIGAVLLTTHASRRGRVVRSAPAPAPAARPPERRDPGLVVPATVGVTACENAAAACNPRTPIPGVMHRAMQFALIRVGRQCRATRAGRLSDAYAGGVVIGGSHDPVRPLIANRVDLRRRTVELGQTQTPGWGAIKLVWLSDRAYQGPFVIRAQPLLHSGPIRLGTGAPPPSRPLVVAPGPTINAGAGFRTLPSSIWVRRPGCYGLQVDGLTFTADFVIHIVTAPRRAR